MRGLLLAAVGVFAFAGVAEAASVRGYFRSDGTYVAPSYRSSPNSTTLDNYSTRGNVNPYTGQAGTRSPTPSYGYQAPSYTAPSYTAPRYNAPSYSAPRQPSYGSSYGSRRSSDSSYGFGSSLFDE